MKTFKFVDANGTTKTITVNEIAEAVAACLTITDKGNLQIASPEGKKLNLESDDNIAIKPVGNVQHDTSHYAEGEDKSEFCIKAICEDKDHVEGYNIEAAGVKFITKKADTTLGWDPAKWILKIQKSATAWAKGILNAASWDIRTRATAAGTGGGIAMQIASCDSSYKENKFKIETDRKVDVTADNATSTTYSDVYGGEGGKGIEIVTINSQMTSIYTKDYRFRGEAPIYGVTRGTIATSGDKTDYPTQADDSKDIKNDASPITWNDLIACVKAWKATQSQS